MSPTIITILIVYAVTCFLLVIHLMNYGNRVGENRKHRNKRLSKKRRTTHDREQVRRVMDVMKKYDRKKEEKDENTRDE